MGIGPGPADLIPAGTGRTANRLLGEVAGVVVTGSQIVSHCLPPTQFAADPATALHQTGLGGSAVWSLGRIRAHCATIQGTTTGYSGLVLVARVVGQVDEFVRDTGWPVGPRRCTNSNTDVAAAVTTPTAGVGGAAAGAVDPEMAIAAGRVVEDRYLAELRLSVSGIE